MATSQKKPAPLKPSSISDFKKKRSATMELPSGMIAKLRNPGGMRVFMGNGTIPNSLMPVVKETLDGNKADGVEVAQQTLADVDEAMIADMMRMMDSIAVACFVEPKVFNTPENEDDREDDKLYADEVDDEDKMFIFRWVSGGTSDVEQFRQEQAGNVAALAGQPAVGGKTQ